MKNVDLSYIHKIEATANIELIGYRCNNKSVSDCYEYNCDCNCDYDCDCDCDCDCSFDCSSACFEDCISDQFDTYEQYEDWSESQPD